LLTRRTYLRVNVPVIRRQRSILSVYGGAAWIDKSLKSSKVVSDSLTIYFENSSVRQTLVEGGLRYDFLQRSTLLGRMTCASLSAGYTFPVSPANWYSNGVKLAGKPAVSYEGVHVSIAFTVWRVKKKWQPGGPAVR
jgi:hypothetical protein